MEQLYHRKWRIQTTCCLYGLAALLVSSGPLHKPHKTGCDSTHEDSTLKAVVEIESRCERDITFPFERSITGILSVSDSVIAGSAKGFANTASGSPAVEILIGTSRTQTRDWTRKLKTRHGMAVGWSHAEVRVDTLSRSVYTIKLGAEALPLSLIVFQSSFKEYSSNEALRRTIQNKWLIAAAAYIVILLLTWLLILWLHPSWILRINEVLKPNLDFKLPWFGVRLSLRHVLLISFFNFHTRVLDAWVKAHIDAARESFEKKPTAKDRQVHVAVPVFCDGEMIIDLSPAHLRETCQRKSWCLLIWGEGGAGKTSLACQIARWAMSSDSAQRLNAPHAMLPVLIEEDFDFQNPYATQPFASLMDAIRSELGLLVRSEKPIGLELLTHLLKRSRVLVLVDHLSELNETTQKTIRPHHPEFPVKSLIVTSRIEEKFGGLTLTIIRPQRIGGNRLSSFMEAYLKHCGKRELFDDPEYFDACRRLSLMVGDRDITALLAKLYAEQMITTKLGLTGDTLPTDIPELMLNYLNELNCNVNERRFDDRVIHRCAKSVAWQCLKEMHRPGTAKYEEVVRSLEKDYEPLLEYLEKRLRVIQFVGAAKDRVRFNLDPLAEYLAGLYLVDQYGNNESAWRDFISRADEMPNTPQSTQGFLLAVRDCCLATRGIEAQVPESVSDLLGRRAGLDPRIIEEAKLRQRVNLFISNLSSPAPEDREAATKELGKLGKATVPALTKALEDENSSVRRSAAIALGKIGPEAKPAVPALVQACKDKEALVRGAAARTLGEIGASTEAAIAALMERFRDDSISVRNRAANSLSKIGAAAVPMLVKAIEDDQPIIQRSAVNTLGRIGPEAHGAVPILIDALNSDDALLANYAAYALGKIGSRAVPALAKAMKDPWPDVRGLAATALEKMGEDAASGFTALTQALSDPNPRVRRYAAKGLGHIGRAAVPAASTLIKAARDSDGSVRSAAMTALEKIGPVPVAQLSEALEDRDPIVRRLAVTALVQPRPEAISLLRRKLSDKDFRVRRSAAAGLLRLGSVGVNELIEALKAEEDYARRCAASALRKVGPEDVSKLIAVFASDERFGRRAAADAVAEIGPAAIPQLMEALKDERPFVRASAARALKRIGLASTPELLETLKD